MTSVPTYFIADLGFTVTSVVSQPLWLGYFTCAGTSPNKSRTDKVTSLEGLTRSRVRWWRSPEKV